MLTYFKGFGPTEATSLVRHAMTAGGPLLAAHGGVDAATIENIGGVLIFLIGIIWGQVTPEKRVERAQRAASRAANANR